jgi:isoleucyl-tRNA synthetase
MYTLGARSGSRRSVQTAMYLIADGLARLLAPILPTTADELWRHIPGERTQSVHLEEFQDVQRFLDRELMTEWDQLLVVRDQVNAALEQQRKDKVIGNSLSAHVTLTATGPVGELLERYREQLPMLFIVSDLDLRVGAPGEAGEVTVDVGRARGVKCERCWRYVPSVRTEPDWAGICDRCVEALAEPVNR